MTLRTFVGCFFQGCRLVNFIGQTADLITYLYCCIQIFDGRGRSVSVDSVRTFGVGEDHGYGGHSETLPPVESRRSSGGEIRQRVRLQLVTGANAQFVSCPIKSRGQRKMYLVQAR